MPNNTDTRVSIEGPLYIIDAMTTKLKECTKHNGTTKEIGFLETFVGDPANKLLEEDRNKKDADGMPYWYESRINGWGTKWDVYHVSLVERKFFPAHAGFDAYAQVTCVWNTAWSPCMPAMRTLSRLYDLIIKLDYVDEGLFYVGHTTIINGKDNLVRDYSGKDVYQGIYELFGSERFFEFFQESLYEPDYSEEILEAAKKFVTEPHYKKLVKVLSKEE